MALARRVGCSVFLAFVVAVTATRAGAAGESQLRVWDAYVDAGRMPSLQSKMTYATHALPVGLRITPVGRWKGAQWGSNHLHPASFGRVMLSRKGVLVLVTAGDLGAPDPAATVERLRPLGLALDGGSYHGVMYEPTQQTGAGHALPYYFDLPAALSRYPGFVFDADLRWPDRLYPPQANPPTRFVPFSPRTAKAANAPDTISVLRTAQSLGFTPRTARFVVLDVHGHTVVILIATEASTVEKTPYASLLAEIRPTLNSIRFDNR